MTSRPYDSNPEMGEPPRINVMGRPTFASYSVLGSMPMFWKKEAARSSGVNPLLSGPLRLVVCLANHLATVG